MSTRYDYGGTGWGVGPELSAQRLMMDGQEAEMAYLLSARNVHGLKYDYTRTSFVGMKRAVIIGIDGEWWAVPAYLHLIDAEHGGRGFGTRV